MANGMSWWLRKEKKRKWVFLLRKIEVSKQEKWWNGKIQFW